MTNTSKMPWLKEDYTVRKEKRDRTEKRWEDFSIAEIEKEESENKNTMTWKDAVTIIQMLVNEKDNKIIKQAWERILQG